MIKGTFPIERFKEIDTPFYYYDTKVLRETLDTIREELRHNPEYEMHYAIEANANPKVLRIISAAGFGADCVSGGEVRAAIEAGFPAEKVVFAGVGKSDREINLALDYGIHCFNVESEAELLIINELAEQKGKVARIALRINPNIGAHTQQHHHRIGRKQVRHQPGTDRGGYRTGHRPTPHRLRRHTLPHRLTDYGYDRLRGTM
jgi:diaminopimelate decarboxylase